MRGVGSHLGREEPVSYGRALRALVEALGRWGTGARFEGAVRVVAAMWSLDPATVALDAAEARGDAARRGRP